MNNKKFEEILERRIGLIKTVLGQKKLEYAGDESRVGYDRLHNFNRAARTLGVSREKALVGMWIKQIVSVLDIVDCFETKMPTIDMVEEKIGDSINYLILLEAMTKEDIGNADY